MIPCENFGIEKHICSLSRFALSQKHCRTVGSRGKEQGRNLLAKVGKTFSSSLSPFCILARISSGLRIRAVTVIDDDIVCLDPFFGTVKGRYWYWRGIGRVERASVARTCGRMGKFIGERDAEPVPGRRALWDASEGGSAT